MLNTASVINRRGNPSLFSLPKPFLGVGSDSTSHVLQLHIPSVRPFLSSRNTLYGTARTRPHRARDGVRVMAAAVATTDIENSVSVKAIVFVKRTIGGTLSNIGFSRGLDDITDLLGKTLLLELVSAELDPKTGIEKATIRGYAHHVKDENGMLKYEAKFEVPPYFGEIGAVLVENEHHKEMYLADIVLDGLPLGLLRFSCNSWVHSKFDLPEKRIFFSNKSYLPSQTPSGLKRLRERELENLRGDGQGERKPFERIYDYDTYNDLGNPDKTPDLARPVLGGQDLPYPRRCKTGRPRSKQDPLSESRSSSVYVPRDEQFAEVKQATFSAKTVYSVLHAVVPSLDAVMVDSDSPFPYFTAIDLLFHEGLRVPGFKEHTGLINVLPRLVKALNNIDDVLRFEPPGMFDRDRFSWFRDEEFSRQTLAGLNPCSIKLVTEWPLMSKLDPEIYGPPESAITKELVEVAIGGLMTLEEVNYMIKYTD